MNEDILQVHIPGDGEYEPLVHVEVSVDDMEYSAVDDTRHLVFSRNGEIAGIDDEPYTFQSSGGLFRTVIPDENVALGYFLHALETHGVDEEMAVERLTDLGIWLDEHREWTRSFSPRDRRLRLLDLAVWRSENGDFASAVYLDDCSASWRSQNLSESGRKLAAEIQRTVDVKPKLCYWTAQRAILKHGDNRRVKYVEGLVLPKQLGQCIRHAWLEIDGEVAELTWPWHRYSADGATYFGVEFHSDEVRDARGRRDVHGALALTDEEVTTVGKTMGNR